MVLNQLISSPKTVFRFALLSLLFGVPTASYAAPAIVTGNVNVREGASTRFRKVGTLRPGWQVDAGPCQAGWCHVRVGRIFGWASARYLSFSHYAQPAPYYRSQPSVIIESGPVIRPQPFWGWGGWGNDDWGFYRPSGHYYRPHYRQPYRPGYRQPYRQPYRQGPPKLSPQPLNPGSYYNPYRDAGAAPAYRIGEGVRPAR